MSLPFQLATRFSVPWEYSAAISDETTALTTGTKLTISIPYDVVVYKFVVTVTTAPTGSSLIVDVTQATLSIFSKSITVPVSAFTSEGGAVSYTLKTTFIPANTVITVGPTQVGATVAGAGAKIWFIGYRSTQN